MILCLQPRRNHLENDCSELIVRASNLPREDLESYPVSPQQSPLASSASKSFIRFEFHFFIFRSRNTLFSASSFAIATRIAIIAPLSIAGFDLQIESVLRMWVQCMIWPSHNSGTIFNHRDIATRDSRLLEMPIISHLFQTTKRFTK